MHAHIHTHISTHHACNPHVPTFAATAMRWLMPTTPPRNPRPYRLQASEPASAAVGAGVAVGAGTDAKADAVADAWSSDTDPDMPALLDAIVGGGCVCGWLEVEGVWEVWLGGGWRAWGWGDGEWVAWERGIGRGGEGRSGVQGCVGRLAIPRGAAAGPAPATCEVASVKPCTCAC
eukprot:1002923-Pelagomonas_calceolata.AAC.4